MVLQSLRLLVLFLFHSLTAQADPVVIPVPVPTHGDCYDHPSACQHPKPLPHESCKAYNRDGITCEQVGFQEGQIGYPWGYSSGQFRCENGCLAWMGQSNACKAYNRDGITCQQVDYHEGQVGYPWGLKSGKFRCTSGCLQFIWWW